MMKLDWKKVKVLWCHNYWLSVKAVISCHRVDAYFGGASLVVSCMLVTKMCNPILIEVLDPSIPD